MQPTDLRRSVSDASARSVSQGTMRLLSVSTLLLFFCTSGNRDARLDTSTGTEHDLFIIVFFHIVWGFLRKDAARSSADATQFIKVQQVSYIIIMNKSSNLNENSRGSNMY